ncbi:HNH endonuclease [Halalkalicoccus sp. NIPERK01]|uniref:HNH endonuclease n=1 Tax=Halalkalicoccus sp. NIPERK01 TaxID=3053469 RepID=UPI0034E952F6
MLVRASDAVRKCIDDESRYATASKIRERDGRIYQNCGKESNGRRLDGHHIIPIISGGCNAAPPLMTLCGGCHRTIESYTRTILNPILVDWSLEDLPEDRLSGAEYMRNVVGRPIGQSELTDFMTSG